MYPSLFLKVKLDILGTNKSVLPDSKVVLNEKSSRLDDFIRVLVGESIYTNNYENIMDPFNISNLLTKKKLMKFKVTKILRHGNVHKAEN